MYNFAGLSDRQVYDVVTALRGPDLAALTGEDANDYSKGSPGEAHMIERQTLDTVKTLIVGRLRAIVFPEYADMDVVSRITKFPGTYSGKVFEMESLITLDRMSRTFKNKHWHFFNHLRYAVEATQSNPIWGGYGKSICVRL